jgi:hypothetical protein
MWPFNSERKRTIRQLGAFVSPDVVDEILSHSEPKVLTPRQMFIGYIITQVRDEDTAQLNDCVSKIIDVTFQNGGVICVNAISLLIITFGAPIPAQSDPASVSKAVATQLVEGFPNDVKVIYGSGDALVGSWGHPQHMTYGPMFPLFSQRLEALCAMDYGSLREINL